MGVDARLNNYSPILWQPHPGPEPLTPLQQNQLASINLRLQSFARFAEPEAHQIANFIRQVIIPAAQWVINIYIRVPAPIIELNYAEATYETQEVAYQQARENLNHLMAFVSNTAQSSNQTALETLQSKLQTRNLADLEHYVATWQNNFSPQSSSPV